MFKLTVYKKVNLSRNFYLIFLSFLLVLVGGKIILAHEKLTTYQEAMQLYRSGNLVEAEKKLRAAKLNLSVTDHNKDINMKLSLLSPIREVMEDLDEKAASYYKDNELDLLVDMYDRWQTNQQKWVSGTNIQKDMYGEMLALTKLDQDMKGYFSTIKKTNLAKLENGASIDQSAEEQIYTNVNKIPNEYFGGEAAKSKEIITSFQMYYEGKVNKLTSANAPVIEIVTEGNRQLGMLSRFSIESGWLVKKLDTYLLNVLTTAIAKKDYATFAEQANSTKKLSSNMKDAKVLAYIEKSKSDLLSKAKKLTASNKYEEAISIYEALTPLENTEQLIAKANLAWDKYEPIRVLKRLYPDKEFPNFVNARNKWGADSVVAAISKDGKIYFGRLKGEEPMVVTEGTVNASPVINKLSFQSSYSTSDNPVLFIDAKSSERKHHYLAYEVESSLIKPILDVEADNLTVEAKQVLLLDNPVGQGAGELAYFEPGINGEYQFTKIKVDYVDIQVSDIASYFGKKVRFTAYAASKTSSGAALVTLSEGYNYSTGKYEKSYLILNGSENFTIYTNYTVIGVFNSYTTITNENGEQVRVPVIQVEKVE
ncbi:hypothetical protein AA0X95_06780 [Bacillus sp. 1P10SD]|uniref:hypothetical protein n=1 Tax=Bacillus sp. 1P10SD TaxID=3132265 RepID=UPI0039A7656C